MCSSDLAQRRGAVPLPRGGGVGTIRRHREDRVVLLGDCAWGVGRPVGRSGQALGEKGDGGGPGQVEVLLGDAVTGGEGGDHLGALDRVDAEVGLQVEVGLDHVVGVAGRRGELGHELPHQFVGAGRGRGRRGPRCRAQRRGAVPLPRGGRGRRPARRGIAVTGRRFRLPSAVCAGGGSVRGRRTAERAAVTGFPQPGGDVHTFFHNKGYYYFHAPLITASDCEGAGQMFQVTTLNPDSLPRTEEGQVDYRKDFFGRHTSLTVSGQLEGEMAAMALGGIYTFGPTFRAENSNTPRHLAEFWMIEPEVAFLEIEDNMDLAEEFIKYCVQWALDNCMDDISFLSEHFDKELIDRLKFVLEKPFVRLAYTEGIRILEEAVKNGVKFEFPIYWGADLASEHERYLVEVHFKTPVIMTDYPKEIKSFYMKLNDDGKTVRGMDVLFPKIGEIIGGSEREADYDKLVARANEMGVPEKDIWWYLDSRRYGTAPHSGFGLGFERLLLFVTGMSNIRDVIPFPRTPNNAEF